jgi:type I restriction enzyme S subunit
MMTTTQDIVAKLWSLCHILRDDGVITADAVSGSATQLIPAGSVLIVTRSGFLRHTLPVGVSTREVAINQDLKALTPHQAVNPIFMGHQIRSSSEAILSTCAKSGTTVDSIDFERLKAFRVAVPPLREQRRIVAKIDSLTAKSTRARENLDHIPRLVEKYKQAILSAAFGGELTRGWRDAHRLPEPKAAGLRELLAAPIRNGLSVRGTDTPPGVRALRLSALRGGRVNLDDVRYLPIHEDRADRFLLKSGDVLVSRGNGTKEFVGLAALVETVGQPTIFPDTAFRLRLDYDIARPLWITHMWNAREARQSSR